MQDGAEDETNFNSQGVNFYSEMSTNHLDTPRYPNPLQIRYKHLGGAPLYTNGLTFQLTKGKNTPNRNIAIVGPPQAEENVTVICITVPPISLATNPRHMETTPAQATVVEKLIFLRDIAHNTYCFRNLFEKI